MNKENVTVTFRNGVYTKKVNYYRVDVVGSKNNRWVGTVYNLDKLSELTSKFNVIDFIKE